MSRLLLPALVIAAACSPSVPVQSDAPGDSPPQDAPDPNDGARSGMRLKLTWYEFTDGTKQWSGMYDSERKEYCSPYYSAWTDGNTYCVPEHGGSLVYTNATCTNRAMQVYVDTTCPQMPPKYYLEYASGTCSSAPAHLYVRGAKLTGVTSYYYKNANGTCGAANPAQTYDSFYAMPSEVPTTDLVKITLMPATGAGRIGVRAYESPDGMRFPYRLHDNQVDTDCYADYYGDTATTATCPPANARYAAYDHDAACAQPELGLSKSCPAPQFGYTYPDTSCPYDNATFYSVGQKVTAPPLYYSSGATCTATTPDATYDYYTLGAAVPAAQLARAADTDNTRRIQLVHFTTPDGLRFRDLYTVYDAQKQTACYPEQLDDGTIRCVAYGGYVDTYYSSSACTTKVDVVELYTGPAGCTPPTVPKYARKYIAPPAGSCAYTTEVHPITTKHTATVFTGVPGSCTAYTPYEGELYNIGAAVPVTDFVGASIVVDP